MLTDEQRTAFTDYIQARARYVIETFGLRPPGSDAERKTQELVRDDLATVCDGPVVVEEFPVAQKAFFAMQPICGLLTLTAFACYWMYPPLALLFSLSALTILYFQLLRYRLLLDTVFPKKPSYNVTGRIRPAGEIKRRLVLNGHPDAAYEWTYNYLVPKLFPLLVLYTLLGLFATMALTVTGTILTFAAPGSMWLTWLGYAALPFLPGAVVGLFFNNFGMVAGGANDNLTGTFMAAGMLKFLKEAGVQLQNTELVAAVTGSEEAGLRGAKVWARAHHAECLDVETVVIALDTLRDLPHLMVYNRDLNGTVKHDAALCAMLKEVADEVLGRPVPYGTVFLGSSDGAAFTQEGFRAAAICAMDPHPAHYYHNRRDTWEDMDPVCLRKCIDILLEAIKRYDEHGLPAS